MAATRFDVCSPRPRKDSDKPYWHRVGSAWQSEKGIRLTFDSLPLPDKEGQVSVVLFEAKKDGSTAKDDMRTAHINPRQQESKQEMDDEIPF